MYNYHPITIYDSERIHSHPLYKKNAEFIKEYGMDSFLIKNGIMGGVVPYVKYPNEKLELELINYGFSLKYRTTRKSETEFNTEYFEIMSISKDESEVTTLFLLKAFEFIEKWLTLEKEYEKNIRR